MPDDVISQIQALRGMSVSQLRIEWERLYGETTRSRNRDYLWKRLAWRVQELKYGGLSNAAKQRLRELAPTTLTYVRAQRPRGFDPEAVPVLPAPTTAKTVRDARLPAPGSVINRKWRGRDLRLLVRDDGFEIDGVVYGSLSEAARGVTGQRWNGPLFWGLRTRKRN
jgi:hypothetical protein